MVLLFAMIIYRAQTVRFGWKRTNCKCRVLDPVQNEEKLLCIYCRNNNFIKQWYVVTSYTPHVNK